MSGGNGKADNQKVSDNQLDAPCRADRAAQEKQLARTDLAALAIAPICSVGSDSDRINWLIQNNGLIAANLLREILDPNRPLDIKSLRSFCQLKSPPLYNLVLAKLINRQNGFGNIETARPRHDVLIILSESINPALLYRANRLAMLAADADLSKKLLEFDHRSGQLPGLEDLVLWVVEHVEFAKDGPSLSREELAGLRARIKAGVRQVLIATRNQKNSDPADLFDLSLSEAANAFCEDWTDLCNWVGVQNMLEAAVQLKRELEDCSSELAAPDLLDSIQDNVLFTSSPRLPTDYLFGCVLDEILRERTSASSSSGNGTARMNSQAQRPSE